MKTRTNALIFSPDSIDTKLLHERGISKAFRSITQARASVNIHSHYEGKPAPTDQNPVRTHYSLPADTQFRGFAAEH